MSEAEILEQLFSLYDRYWVIVQWWASVLFALIAAAHLPSEKINPFPLVSILVLYTAYSLWLCSFLDYKLAIMFGLFGELNSLLHSGEITKGGREVLEQPSVRYGLILGWTSLPVTFCACAGYLLYSFVHVRKSR